MLEGWQKEDAGIFAGKVIRECNSPDGRKGRLVCQVENDRDADLIIAAQDLLKAVIMADPSHEASWFPLIERIRDHLKAVSGF